ncbi:LysR substrate-binding domain-containing protein [Priestia sp. YIM B13446]|jgi:DNA-binding transcriptional LysR family regulator|nr:MULTISPECIES: LysR family transcriptional regulator [Priestia]RCX24071.1 DNA-binding transcriptional LysR family regulator [Bacillus sp. AG236]MBX9996639.1 LysR family transcriptional regulator [Priestia aryabhattai]MDC7720962.1 LysR family transcriptional regulator [Priestia megaterium]MED4052105.1 LysR family transcriptional regulator [Priestia megaterium]MED4061961.1 LysR family transcriptional regulator [Priestia megaterium]
MNIEQLKHMVEIDKTGSLKEAANNLHITLPALSQSIKNLEKELNIMIFHRSRRGSIPTEEGHRLIEKANSALLKIQEFMDEAEAYTNTMNGEIKIATYPGPMEILVHLITEIKREYPNIKASVYENSTEYIIDKVLEGEVDVGFITYTEKEETKYRNLVFKKLLDGHMVAAVNKKSPLAKQRLITEEMLLNQPIVLYNDKYIQEFMKGFSSLPFDILFTTNNVDTIRNTLENNTAINIGFDYAFKTDAGLSRSDQYVVVNFAPPHYKTYSFGYFYNANNGLSRIIREFLKRIHRTIVNNEL